MSIEHLRHIKADILGCSSDAVNIHSKGMEAIGDVKNACVTEDGTPLHVDNMAAVHIATSDKSSKRAKHINVRFMNVRDKVLEGVVRLVWVPTEAQIADLLTKCLGRTIFEKFRSMIMG